MRQGLASYYGAIMFSFVPEYGRVFHRIDRPGYGRDPYRVGISDAGGVRDLRSCRMAKWPVSVPRLMKPIHPGEKSYALMYCFEETKDDHEP